MLVKKALINDYFNDKKTIIIDATETPIQRKKKRQKQSYSGKKKKKHTIKTQVIIEQETKKIIATKFFFEKKKKHDYALFKESKIPILKKIPN
ncbi:transposase [Spiroplasma poulsonii]|uniref:transposase n=1 Tax=Spiroplasma poulsonii TaxID=2138 RepID=UPI0026BF66B6